MDFRQSSEVPFHRGSAFLMFLILLSVYFVSALPMSRASGTRLVNVLTIAVVFFGLRSVTRRNRYLWVGLGLTFGFALLSEVLRLVGVGRNYRWDSIFALLVFVCMLLAMVRVVMRPERVGIDKIFAAACVYMLMGICFGLVYVLLEQTTPGSFTLSDTDLAFLGSALIHYSFTTLTTVGYGNISPVSAVARSLSDIEAVLAQLYLAVVVARLVSLEITQGSSLDESS